MTDSPVPFRERLVSNICAHDFLLYLAFIVEVVFLIFSLLSYLFAELDRATHTILLVNFTLLGIAFALTIFLITVCSRNQ